jgi:hypothetical protein
MSNKEKTGKRVLKLMTAEAQIAREMELTARVIEAIAAYCRAGNPPTLKDARIVERVVARAARTLREELSR